ncbi:ATP-binding cassette domain-containing protein [Absicoccus porci]|uniref:ATP-binding cassette domain-containing protein n=1 Tax=Absicoccus porci TaxID=2486576 RepID=UPI003D943C9A
MLKDIHFTIPHGKSIAFVGPSGGGKTTICSLIPRFYDVTKGKIVIGQQNIKDVQLKSLRQAIGIVQQDVYLFAGTIRENILYGNPKATEEEMIEATKKSKYSFIYLFFTKRL